METSLGPYGLKVKIAGIETILFVRGGKSGWFLHAIGGSESSFDWATFSHIQSWIAGSPPAYAFQAFPANRIEDGETLRSVVVLGVLQEGMYFGYQGFESFWGGWMSLEDVQKIFRHLKDQGDTIGIY